MAKLALLLSATCTVLINNYIFSKYHKYITYIVCQQKIYRIHNHNCFTLLLYSVWHSREVSHGKLMEKFCNQWCKVKFRAVTIHWPAWVQKMTYTILDCSRVRSVFHSRLLIYAALCIIYVQARISAASQGVKHDLKHLFTLQVLFFLDNTCVNTRLKGNKKVLNQYIYILQPGGEECAVVNSHRPSNFLNIEVLQCLFHGQAVAYTVHLLPQDNFTAHLFLCSNPTCLPRAQKQIKESQK